MQFTQLPLFTDKPFYHAYSFSALSTLECYLKGQFTINELYIRFGWYDEQLPSVTELNSTDYEEVNNFLTDKVRKYLGGL